MSGIAFAAVFYWKNLRGSWPAIKPPAGNVVNDIEVGNAVLTLPEDFSISIFAKDIPGARVMKFDGFGNMWISQTKKGIISLVEVQDGEAVGTHAVLRNLRNPHGLVFDPQNPFMLYFAEEDKISRVGIYSDSEPEKIADLPAGGEHDTRTLGFGPDGRLYVSIGSSCNACIESDERRAAIYSMNKDGSDFREFARGLRNAVFFTWSEVDGRMWATEMGRDLLGDDRPPDEINIVVEGGNYGWPFCYGQNIHDTDFNPVKSLRDNGASKNTPCVDFLPAYIDLQAHSAPLGVAFVPESTAWPEEYWYDLIVAYHGSWNRTIPTGYKLVRIKLDAFGNVEGMEDFVTGWLTGEYEALGRPVDIVIQRDGTLYISDDKAGVIYKLNRDGTKGYNKNYNARKTLFL